MSKSVYVFSMIILAIMVGNWSAGDSPYILFACFLAFSILVGDVL